MLYSMTGFGKGEVNLKGGKLEVEIHSLNRKHFELSVHLPKIFLALEPDVRKKISRHISRGRVNAQVNFEPNSHLQGSVVVNKGLARRYFNTYRELKKEFGLGGTVDLSLIVQAQDVVKFQPVRLSPKEAWPAIQKGIQSALDALLKMRRVEGKSLFNEIFTRLKLIQRAVKRVEKTVPKTVKAYEVRLLKKIRETDVTARKNEDLIMKEISLFADRIDVTEELSRLDSHLSQFGHLLHKKEPMGRSLDFILQEMHREVNTIGSKANSATVAREVVFLKSEIEKIREQIQNVE